MQGTYLHSSSAMYFLKKSETKAITAANVAGPIMASTNL